MRLVGLWILLLPIAISQAVSQTHPPAIREIIDDVTLDSLTYTVNVLSGETGCNNQGTSDTIRSRFRDYPGHDLARDFLKGKLESYGLSTRLQPFTLNLSGVNVLAEQLGTTYPDLKYILCAHYDSISDSAWISPGADDNASGVSAVLEAARVLSRYKTAYTVVYALWDDEELGRLGSGSYSIEARARSDSILGVINVDMIGYDGDNDSVMELHGRAYANTLSLIDTAVLVQNLYGLGLTPQIHYPYGVTSSDHSAFYNRGYGALWMVHGFQNRDAGPYYHSTADRIQYFSLPYFHRIAKLAAGTIALLADVQGTASVPQPNPLAKTFSLEQNYPNPFNPSTTIRYALPHRSYVALTVFNTLGQPIAELVRGELEAGYHETRFDAGSLASGVYFYCLRAGDFVQTKKLVLLH